MEEQMMIVFWLFGAVPLAIVGAMIIGFIFIMRSRRRVNRL